MKTGCSCHLFFSGKTECSWHLFFSPWRLGVHSTSIFSEEWVFTAPLCFNEDWMFKAPLISVNIGCSRHLYFQRGLGVDISSHSWSGEANPLWEKTLDVLDEYPHQVPLSPVSSLGACYRQKARCPSTLQTAIILCQVACNVRVTPSSVSYSVF